MVIERARILWSHRTQPSSHFLTILCVQGEHLRSTYSLSGFQVSSSASAFMDSGECDCFYTTQKKTPVDKMFTASEEPVVQPLDHPPVDSDWGQVKTESIRGTPPKPCGAPPTSLGNSEPPGGSLLHTLKPEVENQIRSLKFLNCMK